MKKAGPKKLTLSKETIAALEMRKLEKLVGADGRGAVLGKFSDNWEQTTCM